MNEGNYCTNYTYQYQGYQGRSFALPLGYWVPNLGGTWGWHHLYSNHWCVPR